MAFPVGEQAGGGIQRGRRRVSGHQRSVPAHGRVAGRRTRGKRRSSPVPGTPGDFACATAPGATIRGSRPTRSKCAWSATRFRCAFEPLPRVTNVIVPPGSITTGSVLVSALHARGPGAGVLCDRRPGVVVRRNHALRLQQLDRLDRVVGPHREPIADRQHGQVEPRRADQLHVVKQPGVASEVHLAVGQGQQEAAGIAAVAPVGQDRAVMSNRHLHAAERQLDCSRPGSSAACFSRPACPAIRRFRNWRPPSRPCDWRSWPRRPRDRNGRATPARSRRSPRRP